MAITFGQITAAVPGLTTVDPTYPSTGLAAGDLFITGRNAWLSTATCTNEAGWTAGGDLAGGTGSTADNHTCRVRSDYKEAVGSESGNVTFDIAGSPNGASAVMVRYDKDAAEVWNVATASGDDATHAANRSATATSSLDFQSGDWLIALVAVDTDAAITYTAPALTASGITFGTTTQRTPAATAGSGVGLDGHIEVFDAEVTSGSGTVAPTLSLTTATSQCGPVTFLRLRATPPTSVSRIGVTTGAPGAVTAFSPTLPTHATGDRLTLTVVGKYDTTTVPTINQGWTLVGSATGGTGSAANDTGTVFTCTYAKDATSSSETAPTVTPGATAPNSWEWICASHRPADGKAWADTIGASAAWVKQASDTNTASPLTGTCGAWTGAQPTTDDAIFAVGVIPTDLGTALGATTITATGLSGGTKDTATSQYIENALNADSAAVWAGWTGFTGTASAGLALSFTVTGATNQSGAMVGIALRQTTGGTPLTVQDAAQAQTTDAVALTQHHAATVADTRQLQATDPVALTQHHVLAVQDARQLQATDPITVTYHPPSTALTVNDARQLQTTDPIALVQHRVLTVADTRQLQSSDPAALTQHHVLAPQDARQLQATDPIALIQHRVLTVQDARQLQATDPIALTQHRVLTVADARQLQGSESPALTQHGVLAPQDARQLQTVDPITVVYHPPGAVALTVADARQTQTVDPVAPTQHNVVAPADTRQLQATDPATLTQHHTLAPHDARQLQTADPIALTQHRVLAVQDARQTQATDPIVVTYHPPGGVVVSVNDARQLQAADPVSLTQHGILAPADARQLQSSDPINLTQHAALVVQDARQLQTADSPAVTPSKITITVNDAKQTPTVDSPALTQHHLLTVADTRHNQSADNPALTQHHTLAVQDARQTQKVGNVTFGRPPHITHPNLTVQTNQSALGGQTNHSTLTGQTNQSTLHTPTAGTLLLEPHRHTLED